MTQIKELPYSELNGKIWNTQINSHEIKLNNFEDRVKRSNFYMFTRNICTNTVDGQKVFDHKRHKALIICLGYLQHNYKKPNSKAIVFTESNVDGESQGGTGKSLLIKALSKVRNVVLEDGKNFSFNKNFPFQKVERDSEILVFDDVDKNFQFEKLFSIITDGITIEKKNKDSFYLTPEYTPKIAITSNYGIKGNSSSFLRRRYVMELYRYYSESFSPFDEFKEYFFDDNSWSHDDWNNFYCFMMMCVQEYFRNSGELMNYESETIDLQRIMNEITLPYYEYFEELKVGQEYFFRNIKQDLQNQLGKQYISDFVIKTRWTKYCDFKGYKLDKFRGIRNGIKESIYQMNLK